LEINFLSSEFIGSWKDSKAKLKSVHDHAALGGSNLKATSHFYYRGVELSEMLSEFD